MAKSPNWTTEELTLLIEYYPKLGNSKELQAMLPNRPVEGISLKANRMGLRFLNNKLKRRTNAEYIELTLATNFVPLEEYKGSTIPIKHMCCICDYEWLVRPQHILKEGALCPICSHKARILSQEEVDNTLANRGIERLSKYTGALMPMKVKHNYCGHIWDVKYSTIQQGSGCPVCNKGFGCFSTVPEVATLYLLKIHTSYGTFYKIGVTTRPLNKRIRELKSSIGVDFINIEEVYSITDSGINVLIKEKKILSSITRYFPVNKFEGSTECLQVNTEVELNNIKKMMNETI